MFVPWLIVCAIHITAHFTAHKAQILIFWWICSIFFAIKKRADFCFSIWNFCKGREPGLWWFLYAPNIYADFPCAKFWFNQLLIRQYFIVSFSQSFVLKQLFSLWRINRHLCYPIFRLLWNISIEAIVALYQTTFIMILTKLGSHLCHSKKFSRNHVECHSSGKIYIQIRL